MSTATITRATSDTRRVSPGLRRPARRGPGSVRGPSARPARPVPAPGVDIGRSVAVRSCRVQPTGDRSEWRLTDRGIAVVLVLVGMITVAALVVIGLTAWQVTGAGYATWSAETVSAR